MSRFTGWDRAAIEKLTGPLEKVKITKKPKLKADRNHSEDIARALRILKIDCELEYRFIKDRRFRFDLAIPQHKIAVEFEGGVYRDSRHTRPLGYIQDTKKYNLATMHGWQLLRYTTEITAERNWDLKIALEIQELIKKGKTNGRNSSGI